MAPHLDPPRSTRPSASRWAEQLGRIFERVAVLALNGTSAEIVAVHGLSHAALGVSLSLVERTPLRWAIEAASPVVGSGKSPGGAAVAIALGVPPPRGYVVVPLAMPGGIVGLAYADRGPHPLSLTEVSAAFGFCQTVLAGHAVPTARRPRSSGRRAARAARPRARRAGVGMAPPVLDGAYADLAPGQDAPGAEAAEAPGRADAGLERVAAAFDPEALAVIPGAAEAARSSVLAPPLAAFAAEPSPTGEGSPPEGADRDVALFTSMVQASLAELSRAAGPTRDDDLPLVEDEVVIGADALDASSWRQSWAAPVAAGAPTTDVAPASEHNEPADAPASLAAPAPGSAVGGLSCEPLSAGATAVFAGASSADAGPADAGALPATDPPLVARPAAQSAPGPRVIASPPPPAAHSRAAVARGNAPGRRERRAAPAASAASMSTAGLFAPPAGGVAGFVGGPTLYAQQIAVVTPGGVVPLTEVRRRGMVTRAITTTAAAVATVAALVLTLVAPASNPAAPPRSVVVSPQASLGTISRELEAEGLVRSAAGFSFLARLSGADRALRAGTYRLSPGAWAWEQLRALTGGQVGTVSITIPEGLTLEEIAATIDQHHLARTDDVLTAARAPDLLARYDLPGSSAEGFLFPETYSFATGVSAREIVDTMVRQFFARVGNIPEAVSAGRDELLRKVILASIVEREARDKAERARIAGVFQNRLDRSMRLESCATVQYILGHPKEKLTVADVRRSSPYNTYLHPGLPPAPISNPGLEALRASFAPERHDLLFFFARDDGSHRHVFSRTYAEHMSAQRLVASRERSGRKVD